MHGPTPESVEGLRHRARKRKEYVAEGCALGSASKLTDKPPFSKSRGFWNTFIVCRVASDGRQPRIVLHVGRREPLSGRGTRINERSLDSPSKGTKFNVSLSVSWGAAGGDPPGRLRVGPLHHRYKNGREHASAIQAHKHALVVWSTCRRIALTPRKRHVSRR